MYAISELCLGLETDEYVPKAQHEACIAVI